MSVRRSLCSRLSSFDLAGRRLGGDPAQHRGRQSERAARRLGLAAAVRRPVDHRRPTRSPGSASSQTVEPSLRVKALCRKTHDGGLSPNDSGQYGHVVKSMMLDLFKP